MNKQIIAILIIVLVVVAVLAGVIINRSNQPIQTDTSASSSISRLSSTRSTGSNNNGDAAETSYSLAQLALHSSATDCYTSYKGIVYNLSSFIPMHKGGLDLLPVCGTEADEFSASHPGGSFEQPEVQRVLASLRIGRLVN